MLILSVAFIIIGQFLYGQFLNHEINVRINYYHNLVIAKKPLCSKGKVVFFCLSTAIFVALLYLISEAILLSVWIPIIIYHFVLKKRKKVIFALEQQHNKELKIYENTS